MNKHDPALWLRRRPEVEDTPEEFHRDFSARAETLFKLRQTGPAT